MKEQRFEKVVEGRPYTLGYWIDVLVIVSLILSIIFDNDFLLGLGWGFLIVNIIVSTKDMRSRKVYWRKIK